MITLENGNVQSQGGLAVPNGCISLQLNIDATIIATPFGIIPAQQELVFQFDSTGNLVQPCKIWSNAELNPQNVNGLGTYYLVTFYDANGARINKSPMWWQFIEANGATVDISQVTPYATVGGNVIFYPTSFTVPPPTPTTLGGVFSNAGSAGEFITAINTDGSVSFATPTIAIGGSTTDVQINVSGVLYGDSGFTYNHSTGLVSVTGTINAGAFTGTSSVTGSGGTGIDPLVTLSTANPAADTTTLISLVQTGSGNAWYIDVDNDGALVFRGLTLAIVSSLDIYSQTSLVQDQSVLGVDFTINPTPSGGKTSGSAIVVQNNSGPTLFSIDSIHGNIFTAGVIDIAGSAASTTAAHLNIGAANANPTGSSGQTVTANAAGGSGPATPLVVAGFLEWYIGTQKIWIPFMI